MKRIKLTKAGIVLLHVSILLDTITNNRRQYASYPTKMKGERTTKVFAKAGLDNVTSAMCKYQQWFGLNVQCAALVPNFNYIFSIGHLYRAVVGVRAKNPFS